MSNEIYKNIDTYICDLDNDLSITNDPSYLGNSLELTKGEEVHLRDMGHQAVYINYKNSVSEPIIMDNLNTTGNNTHNHIHDNSLLDDQDTATQKNDETPIWKDRDLPVENDPFVEKNQSLEHEFIINSPFSKPSIDYAMHDSIEVDLQPIFGESYTRVQEEKSATIDDFKGLKAGILLIII